ncbi:hypothetical protein KDU71_02470 [Carboxylicivirga sediminis]|uniref:Uncharacterized protein n=1 Tax=Carboxylicivirga sediminis TaxID=2006564 RepID=A0A941F1T4_9BACT|nr:hypothetical protein [Carboxylicivirga sediminis]MBR8534409.1 hypothetical protein [Carboxylicivirga sediminis]
MNKKLQTFLTNLALLGMIAELSYINSKSLLHLANNQGSIHQAFAIVGAIAFSIVTIIIMQQSHLKWQKVAFPVFDAALVFLGFNLDIHPDMRIFMTIFMALFAGIIMYSLGLIEYRQGETKESKQLAYQIARANSLGKELEATKSKLTDAQRHVDGLINERSTLESKNEQLQSNFTIAQSKLDLMEPIYLKHEIGRIRKKNADNRTESERQLLATAN